MDLTISLLLVVCGVSATFSAALPTTHERNVNVIVLEVTSIHDGDNREDRTFPEGEDRKSFEIVVPVARNFSSIDELYNILKEDNFKPREASKPASTYVKGTEKDSSEYVLFMSDSPGESGGSK